MKQLQQRLTKEVERGTTFKVREIKEYYIELSSVEVTYQFAYRKRMDILVKMILKTIDALVIKTEQELIDVLLVEQVFVRSLLQMLENKNLIERRSERYILTSEGAARLAEGFFIRKTEHTRYEIYFQPALNLYLYEWEKIASQKYLCHNFLEVKSAIHSSFSEIKVFEDMILLQEQEETEYGKIIVEKVLASEHVGEEQLHFLYVKIYSEEHQEEKNRIWNLHTMKWDDELFGVIHAQLKRE